MPEKEMWKSINFALTMAFMGDIMSEGEDRRENDLKLLSIKAELEERMNSLIGSLGKERVSESLSKAEKLSRMLVLSILCMLAKRAESSVVTDEEVFAYLNERLDLGVEQYALKVLCSDEDELREALLKSMKSLILMGLKTENMTDVLHLFKALAGLSRVAEEALREREEFKEMKTGAVAAELGELALDASEMARAEVENDEKQQIKTD